MEHTAQAGATGAMVDPLTRGCVDLAAPHLAAAGVPPQELQRISAAATLLPPVHSGLFEIRLGTPAAQVDFLPRFTLNDCRHPLFHERLAALAREASPDDVPIWQAIHEFCARWADPAQPLNGQIQSFWTELDLVRTPAGMPTPCFYFDFPRGSQSRDLPMREIVSLFHAARPPFQDNLERCLGHLGGWSQLYSLGLMLGRGQRGVRLCVSLDSPRQVVEYLEKIGWGGRPERLLAALERFAQGEPRLGLLVDVDERIHPRVGVELHVEGRLAERQAWWRSTLGGMTAGGLCLPAKRDAVLAWSGHEHERNRPGSWPQHLKAASAASEGSALSTFLRRISHFKLVYTEGEPLEAKAYLEFMHSWLQREPEKGEYRLGEMLL